MTEKQTDECRRILYLFSEICPGLEVPAITDELYRWLCEAGAELVKRKSRFTDLFMKVAASDYLMGRKDNRFTARLGWILKPETIGNILAGKYDDRRKEPSSGRVIQTRDDGGDIGYKYLDEGPAPVPPIPDAWVKTDAVRQELMRTGWTKDGDVWRYSSHKRRANV